MMYAEETRSTSLNADMHTNTKPNTNTKKSQHTNISTRKPQLGFLWLNMGLIAIALALFLYIDNAPTMTIESFEPNSPLPAKPFWGYEFIPETETETPKEKEKEKEEEEKVVEFYEECPEDVEEINYVALLVSTPTYSIDPILLFSIIKDTWGDEAKIRIIRGCTPFDQEFLGKLS